jgi:hypothetical protein
MRRSRGLGDVYKRQKVDYIVHGSRVDAPLNIVQD